MTLLSINKSAQANLLIQLKSSRYYKKHGGLYSAQRVEVIKAFLELDGPIDAERLWMHMVNSGRKVSLSCVRSALNWLVINGLVTKWQNASGVWEFNIETKEMIK